MHTTVCKYIFRLAVKIGKHTIALDDALKQKIKKLYAPKLLTLKESEKRTQNTCMSNLFHEIEFSVYITK